MCYACVVFVAGGVCCVRCIDSLCCLCCACCVCCMYCACVAGVACVARVVCAARVASVAGVACVASRAVSRLCSPIFKTIGFRRRRYSICRRILRVSEILFWILVAMNVSES